MRAVQFKIMGVVAVLQESKVSRRFADGLLVLACAASLLGANPSSAAAEPPSASPALGKYVRIEHRGEKPGAIEIAEVQVFSDGVNIASNLQVMFRGAKIRHLS
jgi:hypothetical protein